MLDIQKCDEYMWKNNTTTQHINAMRSGQPFEISQCLRKIRTEPFNYSSVLRTAPAIRGLYVLH